MQTVDSAQSQFKDGRRSTKDCMVLCDLGDDMAAVQAHAAVQNGLVDITRSCQQVVAELRRECQSISQESTRAIAAVAAARKSLHNFFMTHRSACR